MFADLKERRFQAIVVQRLEHGRRVLWPGPSSNVNTTSAPARRADLAGRQLTELPLWALGLENPSLALRNGLRVKVAAMTASTHNPFEEPSWNFPRRAMAWIKVLM